MAEGQVPEHGDGRIRVPWRPALARVVENAPGGAEWYRLVLHAPHVAETALAGQFIECAVTPAGHPGHDPLLKRPFSIAAVRPEAGTVTVIYRAGPGRGTRALTRVAPDQELGILGPLGHSFPHPERLAGRRLALVGGGVGIPPMVAAAAWARAHGVHVSAVAAARTAGALAGLADLQATGVPVTVMTDDGSAGERGLATAPLAQWLAAGTVDEVWACGPEPMLAAVQALAARHGVPAWLALERHMACGFGVCMSCTVPAAAPRPGKWYLKCCSDGPVFAATEVKLGE